MPIEIMLLNLSHWLSAFMMLGLALYSLRFRGAPTFGPLLAFFVMCGVWAFLAALNPHLESFATRILLNRVRMIMPPLLPLAILSLAVTLHGGRPCPKWVWGLLAIIPLTTLGLLLSPWHEIFIGSYRLMDRQGVELLAFSNGPWFMVHNIQARLVIVAAIGLILSSNRNLSPYHGLKSWLISLAIMGPFLIDTIAVMYYETLRFLQLTPALLSLTGLVMAYVIFKRHILDVIPFARSQILDHTPDLYLVFDGRDRLVDFNANAKEVLNLQGQMMGQSRALVCGHEPGLWQHGSEYYEVMHQPLQSSLVDRIGLLIIFKNVSLQKKVELELQEINRMKTRLLAVMGHDLQGSLTGLALTAENLAGKVESYAPQDLSALLDNIGFSARDCVGLVDQLLIWSKSQLGLLQVSQEIFVVETLARDTIAFLNPAIIDKNIQIRVHSAETGPIASDANLVRTVLRNLLSNSIRFTPENGTIEVGIVPRDGQLLVSVVDSGLGMDAEREEKIFEPRKEGAGIGLYLCAEFIGRLGGRIWSESTRGHGRFHFTIPAHVQFPGQSVQNSGRFQPELFP